ncbi:MAG: response regulator [Planctomycetes bacterium]|nr:response regulator [Planctomycetota bacterium]
MTTRGAARICGVTAMTIIRWCEEGRLSAYRTAGGHRRIRWEDLESFCRQTGIPMPDDARRPSRRVLVVDDEPMVLGLFKEVLTAMPDGLQVAVAPNGFEAGQKVSEFRPSLIFLDLYMPGMDGYEVCRRIKGDRATKDIHVVAVTGHPSKKNVERILECGAARCLEKPVTPAQIEAVTREFLGLTVPAAAVAAAGVEPAPATPAEPPPTAARKPGPRGR